MPKAVYTYIFVQVTPKTVEIYPNREGIHLSFIKSIGFQALETVTFMLSVLPYSKW